MSDTAGRIAALEGELEAARARIGELEALRSAAYKYLLGSGETVVEAGNELRARLIGEVR